MALVVLEAMASGKSVVATDVPGVRECLGEEAGAVVPVEDPSALAAALLERARNPAHTKQEGDAARRRAEARFDIGRSLDSLTDVYHELLGLSRACSGQAFATTSRT
jgi:glycosyltransferase involved in cell wall biosynthesis